MLKQNLLILFIFFSFIAFAQNNNAPSSYEVHDIKITGYLQAQFQKAQSAGISTWSGGDFDENANSRFIIRRGRLKIYRVDKYSSIVFQLDGTQDGVRLMDAFIQLHAPTYPSLLFTAGLFNRPSGYSIVYSSGFRDFPERARVFQTLMPRERDLGIMISFHSKKIAKFLTLDLAMVIGSGLNARDYDSGKDLIGNLNFKFDNLAHQKLNIGFGASFYSGTVRGNTTTYFTAIPNEGSKVRRDYYGANFQIEYDRPFGNTTFKTEYIYGKQPGIGASGSITGPVASQSFNTQLLSNLYLRNFNGHYLWLTQQIAKTRFTALLAYDVYDPNTDVVENKIGLMTNNTTAGDVKFGTLGCGVTSAINLRLKLTIYNENVVNSHPT